MVGGTVPGGGLGGTGVVGGALPVGGVGGTGVAGGRTGILSFYHLCDYYSYDTDKGFFLQFTPAE